MGNICRSPIAEAVLRAFVREAKLDGEIEVRSAGTGGWHVGDGADPRALAALSRHGYDASEHEARQFAPAWFEANDLVLAVDRSTFATLEQIAPPEDAGKLRLLREFDPAAGDDLDVPDPYYGRSRGFDDVVAMAERACRGLIEQMLRKRGA